MNIFRKYSQKSGIKSGFTLVELMVVISIIIIFVAIILAAISTARENTREKRRVADLSQIELALTLYKEKHRGYPVAPDAVEIGHGGTLDSEIQQYIGSIPTDPNSEGEAGGTYSYWYDSDFLCKGKSMKVLYVKTMEQAKNANYEEVCGGAALPYLFENMVEYAKSTVSDFKKSLEENLSLVASKAYAQSVAHMTINGNPVPTGPFTAGQAISLPVTMTNTGSATAQNIWYHVVVDFNSDGGSVFGGDIEVAAYLDDVGVGQTRLRTLSLSGSQVVSGNHRFQYCVNPVHGFTPFVFECTAWSSLTVPPPPIAATCDTFTVSPATLPYGGGTVSFDWTTTNATAVSIDGGVGAVSPVDGSKSSVAVSASKTFTLTGTGTGASCTKTATVTVGTQPPVDTSAMYIVVLKE